MGVGEIKHGVGISYTKRKGTVKLFLFMGFYILLHLLVHIVSQKGFEIDALSWIWEHWTAEVSLGKYDHTEISKNHT